MKPKKSKKSKSRFVVVLVGAAVLAAEADKLQEYDPLLGPPYVQEHLHMQKTDGPMIAEHSLQLALLELRAVTRPWSAGEIRRHGGDMGVFMVRAMS